MDQSPITVRLGTTTDQVELARSAQEMMRESEGRTVPDDVVADGVHSILGDVRRGFYVVAECAGAMAGSLLVTPTWIDLFNGCFWWIQCVHVRGEFRRCGCYGRMHDFVRARALEAPEVAGIRLLVDPDNKPARSAYERVGMHCQPYLVYQEALCR